MDFASKYGTNENRARQRRDCNQRSVKAFKCTTSGGNHSKHLDTDGRATNAYDLDYSEVKRRRFIGINLSRDNTRFQWQETNQEDWRIKPDVVISRKNGLVIRRSPQGEFQLGRW